MAGKSAAASHVGKVRANNQDSGYAGSHLFVVADGMGGHAGGDVASAIAIRRIAETDKPYTSAHDAEFALQSALLAANSMLAETVFDHQELTGMGTTVSAILRVGGEVAIAHIGDSRIYLLRDGELTQITADHTFVQRLVDSGRITAEEAAVHPRRSVLMRVLGDVDSAPEIDTTVHDTRDGDRWLLCSDGLSSYVSDEKIKTVLGTVADPDDAAQRLVKESLDQGAPDNVTVVVVNIDESASSAALHPVFVGSADAPLSFEAETSRRPLRLPTLLLHPLRPSPPDDAHFEPESEEYLDELILEDLRRARNRRIAWLVAIALAVLAILVAAVLAYQWTQTRYFVGANGTTVAIYQGVQADLGPIPLSSVYQQTSIRLDSLPAYTRQTVQSTINAGSIDDARSIIARLSSEHSVTSVRTSRAAESAETGQRATLTDTIRLKLRAPARLRNLELVLLLFASAISTGALVLVQLGALGAIDGSIVILGAGLAGLSLIMHIALRFVAAQADPFILPIAILLNGIGIAMIYRLDLADGRTGWDGAGVRQMAWSAIAMAAALVVLIVIRNHRVLQRYRYIAMFVGIGLLLLPLVPGIGREINGSKVWIGIGPQSADGSVPLSFQPGELAKIALAVFFAGYLVTARDSLSMVGKKFLGMRFPRVRDLGPILIIWVAAMAVLVFQRDLGTSLLYFGLFLVMIYVATGRLSWVLLGLALFVGGAVAASQFLGHVNSRFNGWLDAFNPAVYDQAGGSYQLVQGLFGIANGGLVGSGLGQGRPDIVPFAKSDFIIASLGEELGLTGLFALLALFLLFISRGFRIGFSGQDDFGRLLGVGLAFALALQVFIVIGGITRVIPLTGLTTPFMAAGGSSLVANWIIAALLLRLSDTVRNQPRLVVNS